MSFQTSVTGLPVATQGDVITPAPNGLSEISKRVAPTLQAIIGNGAWYLATDENFITNVKGVNTVFAGFVVRQNTNTWPTPPITEGSMIYPAGSNVTIATKGRIAVLLTTIVAGTPVFDNAIYVRDTDGTIATGVTIETGYTKTNFTLRNHTAAAGSIIYISNLDDVQGV